MKKIFIILVLFLCILNITFAHPLDISNSTFNFSKNRISVTTYFHSYEIEYLLNYNKVVFKWVNDYFKNENLIKNYIKENIKINSKDNNCKINDINLIKDEEYKILSSWVEINYNFICDKEINNWEIFINFFTNFPLQTNQILIYDLNNISPKMISSWVLTKDVKTFWFWLDQNQKVCIPDTDWDWISDVNEIRFKTDKNKIDTDWDFYTDYEEIYNSYSPLDKNYWIKQEPRYEIPSEIIKNTNENKITKQDCENWTIQKINWNWLVLSSFWNEYFVNTLKYLSDYVNKNNNTSIFYILLLVVFLWFIHAMGPGHSKSLLISYMIDKKNWFFDWLLYIIIFTITHLIDIILLFLITKIFFSIYEFSIYMVYIQRVSIFILIIFSFYLLYNSIFKINNLKIEKSIKWTLFLWFVSGIAPCTFWWSIFLLLFSLWSLNLILPMIIALWLWIFLCLLLVMTLTYFFRKNLLEKYSWFIKYSSILSSTILIFVWFYLLFKLY